MELQFKVNGMSCQGCKNSVETALNNDERIESAAVNLDEQLVNVNAKEELQTSDINELLENTPYEAV